MGSSLFFRGLRKDDSGTTLIEYSVLLGLIAVSVVVIISEIGGKAGDKWEKVETNVASDPSVKQREEDDSSQGLELTAEQYDAIDASRLDWR